MPNKSSTFRSALRHAKLTAMPLIAVLIGFTASEFIAAPPPACADSEAGSEAGLEAPVNLRQRRRYYMQQERTMQRKQQQQQRAQAAQQRNPHQRQQQQQSSQWRPSQGMVIRNYGGGLGGRSQQSQFSQNNQSQFGQQNFNNPPASQAPSQGQNVPGIPGVVGQQP